jgi:hypothetical protein
MSTAITQSIVHQQLTAMSCERFELGVLHSDGRMTLRQPVILKRLNGSSSGCDAKTRMARIYS